MAKKTKTKGGKPKQKREEPTWRQAISALGAGPLRYLIGAVTVYCEKDYPIAKTDWAYVANTGEIFLNPYRDAPKSQWVYIIGHCALHLGFGHFQKEKMNDPAWIAACDMVVTRFLRDSRIGTPPPEFQEPFAFPVKDEEQVYRQLQIERIPRDAFSAMSGGRPDMRWSERRYRTVWYPGQSGTPDYAQLLARSLQEAIQDSLMSVRGFHMEGGRRANQPYDQARDWFISSYPLLGAVAASFHIVDDADVVKRMNIDVAAISPQMQELYINPERCLDLEEWKFVLAHEFLHAALRHDARVEDRIPELWNVACDYVINGWLAEMRVGMMPEFVLFDSKFSGLSAEAVYDLLLNEIRYYLARNPGDIVWGEEGWWCAAEGAELDEMYRSAIRQGIEYHGPDAGRGFLPAGLVEDIRAISRPPIPWDVELARWFDEQFAPLEKRRTYARLSRRQSSAPDIPRPAWRLEEEFVDQRTYAVVLDTSGSMERSLLARALGSVASYSQARDVRQARVIFCDAQAYDQGMMAPEDIAGVVSVRGRGGTVLQPGLDLLEADERFPENAPVLVITDGDCDRLNFRGREHAFLIPWGKRLPFPPRGPVFRLR